MLRQPIKIDLTEGTQVIVGSGLKAGDQIVIDGTEKLKNGSRVTLHAPPPPSGGTAPAASTTPESSNAAQRDQQQQHKQGNRGQRP